MNENVWVHNLDPFLIQFTSTFGIRWYGLAYLIGFLAGALLMIFIAKRGRRTIKPEMVTDFVTYIVLGTMIGGRVGYALFYSQELLIDFSNQFPFWGVLRVYEGGMASHGGILGIFIATLLFAKRHGLDWRHLGDLTVLGGSIGIFLGRVANFINGELFGREASGNLGWAVKFPGEMYLWLKSDSQRRISELASSEDQLLKMTEAVQTLGTEPSKWNSLVSQVRVSPHARYEIQETIGKIIDAIQTGNDQVAAAIAPYLAPRHPSQLYEALLEGVLIFAVVFWYWRRPRKPGVVGALWLSLYAIVRIIAEQFRMPDAHIGYELLGLTRGQWLSVGMLIGSLALLAWLWTRKSEVIGGWGPEAQRLRDQEP